MSASQDTTTENFLHWDIESEQVGQRLDRFLVSVLDGVSRSGVQQLIADDLVLVNDKASKPGYVLRLKDRVTALRATPVSQMKQVTPQNLPLEVVFEDDDLLVVNKAAGMVVHPAPGNYEGTLVNALVAHYPELQQDESDMRPGIIHRLDKDTSGLLMVAKNTQSQAALIEQMKQHKIIKRYLALVEGNVELDQGSIDAPIGRDTRNRQMMAVTLTEGRDAVTHFRVLQRFRKHTLVLVQIVTGRTHQIRVHFQAIKHPVAGDQTYGSGHRLPNVKLERQFLHAYQLELTHPRSGESLHIEAPLPADLQKVLDNGAVL
ncbi:putative RNA pseudouridine synthase YlyB [Ktedonobacter sp. SOSP1-52]|uniref:RluA family pseudouridine synthase n=1 Tax=Ktedonobacter sp. SOSP1-52 TaxID=2778366 RepID=UPI0019154036|nr:RluA family pseudouridine synthase [Ktedonobacter sp. SOSP1-52]GHO64540.1 putative RNA pseudouridine synthase YlyB [Ktedonobacter sp. SOSP1-52]